MSPPRKRTRNQAQLDSPPSLSTLGADARSGWLVKSNDQSIELVAKGETLLVHRRVLTKNSKYFEKCLSEPWAEAHKGSITFDNIDPAYLALFVGVAYSHSSLVSIQPPQTAENPQCRKDRTPMKDLVEVYKLCDRFVCDGMAEFVKRCICVAIADGHRAMFRADTDESLHRELMGDFADGYEAFEQSHPTQKDLGERLIEYLAGGVNYNICGPVLMELVKDRPGFVAAVSGAFAKQLSALEASLPRTKKRKELAAIKMEGESGGSGSSSIGR